MPLCGAGPWSIPWTGDKTMTRSELAALLAEGREGISRRHADRIVGAIFDAMGSALAQGDRIEIRGFGSFQVRERPARSGRNPKTGEAVAIASRKVAHFRVGKALRERINSSAA